MKENEKIAAAYAKEVTLDHCLARVEAAYSDDWTRTCISQRLPLGCNLPAPVATTIEQSRRGFRDECYKRYPLP